MTSDQGPRGASALAVKRVVLFATIMLTSFVLLYEIAARLFGHHYVMLMVIVVSSAVLASVVNDKVWSRP